MSKEKKIVPEKEVLKDMAAKIIAEPVSFTVRTAFPRKTTRSDKLKKLFGLFKPEPASRTFELKPLYLGTLLQMAPYLIDIDLPDLSKDDLYEKVLGMIRGNTNSQCMLIALAINNDETRPPDELVEYIRRNFTAKILMDVSQVIVNSLDLTSFLSSIILMKKGVSLL